MARFAFSFFRPTAFALAAAALYIVPAIATAQEAAPTEAVSREDASKASDKANTKKAAASAKAHADAKHEETHTGKDTVAKDVATPTDAKVPSASEKSEAIAAAEKIAAYDESKVEGRAKPWQVYYQPAATPLMHSLEGLHDEVMVIITIIVIFVMALMLYIIVRFNKRSNPVPQTFTHNKLIEIIWTVVPILILVAIAIPSLRVHFEGYNNLEALTKPDLTIKVVGHQWYWSYEYPAEGIAFDSNIKQDKDLVNGEPRLLAVDNAVVVPVNKVVRVQMTGADVIHSWAMPAFGLKKDAVPGRLNETWFKAEKTGIYYGQCSELCGKSHGFMPIMVVVVSDEDYATWVKGAKLKYASNALMQFASLN